MTCITSPHPQEGPCEHCASVTPGGRAAAQRGEGAGLRSQSNRGKRQRCYPSRLPASAPGPLSHCAPRASPPPSLPWGGELWLLSGCSRVREQSLLLRSGGVVGNQPDGRTQGSIPPNQRKGTAGITTKKPASKGASHGGLVPLAPGGYNHKHNTQMHTRGTQTAASSSGRGGQRGRPKGSREGWQLSGSPASGLWAPLLPAPGEEWKKAGGEGLRKSTEKSAIGQREALGCLTIGSLLTPATQADEVTPSSPCPHEHDRCSNPFTNSFCRCPKCDFTTSPIREPREPRPTPSLPSAAASAGQRSRAVPGQKGLRRH